MTAIRPCISFCCSHHQTPKRSTSKRLNESPSVFPTIDLLLVLRLCPSSYRHPAP